MTLSGSGEIAVLVGATGDFGRAIARRLVARNLRLVAVGRTEDALAGLSAEIPGIVPCVADIADDSAIAVIAEKLDGPVRLACHGPGLSAPGGVMTLAPEALAASVNIKAGGMLRLARAVDAHLVSGSRLVGIAGHYGLEPTDYACAAGVANAALIALMRQLAIACGRRGITAHTIAPGPADTPRLRRVLAARAQEGGGEIESVLEGVRAESPTGELITPEQVAWAVALLADPEASALTGATITLDGGRRKGLP